MTAPCREAALAPGDTVVWDQAAVMERLGDDLELMAEIVDLLLEDIPPRVAELHTAATPDALRRVAHAIKGAVANVGGDAAAAALFAVERAASEGRAGELPGLCAQAVAAWETLATTLRGWRTRP